MSDATSRLQAARTRLRSLHENREAARLEQQAERLDLAGIPAGRRLLESTPTSLDWIDAYATLLDRFRGEPYTTSITSAYDRKYGRNFPIYNNEADLRLLRAPSRILCQTNTYAQALVGGLRSYIIGPGYSYRAAPRNKATPPAALVEAVQSVVDRFLRRNQWNSSGPWAELDQLPLKPIEGEAFERSLRDGEVTLLHTWDEDAGETIARFIESEFIVQPPGSRWEEYSFGIKTPLNDEERKLAFWISFTGNAQDGDEHLVERISYLPRNTDRILKRGVPDFTFDAYDALSTAQRLRRALAIGGAVKASIVGVRQHKAQTQGQTQAFADALADQQTVDLVTGQQRSVRRYNPGEWEDIDENLEYVRGPGTDVESALVEVLGACLRGAVVRWNGFEWLVSADASSNSYANALAAESPAVKRVADEQASYKALFLRSIAIAVKDAADNGLIRANGRTWEWLEVRQLIEVQVEAPSAEVRDQQGEAQRDLALNQGKVKSIQTICQEQGLDYEREMKNIEEHEERFGDPLAALQQPSEEPPGEGGPNAEEEEQGGGLGKIKAPKPPSVVVPKGVSESVDDVLEKALFESGFTGTVKDKIGRTLKYVNGVRQKTQAVVAGAAKAVASKVKGGASAASSAITEEFGKTAGGHAKRILETSARLGVRVGKNAVHAVIEKYKKLKDQYGHAGAIAILGASVALLPVPVPGAALAPTFIAKGIKALHAHLTGSAATVAAVSESAEGPLDVETLIDEVRAYLTEVYDECEEEMPDVTDEQIAEALTPYTDREEKPEVKESQPTAKRKVRVIEDVQHDARGLMTGARIVETEEDVSEDRGLLERGFTGIDSHGHKWVNGKQVPRDQESGGSQSKKAAPVDLAANRPTRPKERHKGKMIPVKPWRDPPPPKGKTGGGQAIRGKGTESQTKLGDQTEALTEKLGLRNILPKGQRSHRPGENKEKGSTLDREYDHSGYGIEVKMCNTTAAEYRAKPKAEEIAQKLQYAKAHDLTPKTMIAVRDAEAGEVHFYISKEDGIITKGLSAKNYDYVGTVPLT